MRSSLRLRVPHELKTRLTNEAVRKGMSINAIAIQIFWDWMEKDKPAEERK